MLPPLVMPNLLRYYCTIDLHLVSTYSEYICLILFPLSFRRCAKQKAKLR